MIGTCVEWAKFCKRQKDGRVSDRKQNLPQLYRFCFLMLGDLRKTQEVFNTTLREAAVRAAQGEPPEESFCFFPRGALALFGSKQDGHPTGIRIDERDIAPHAASQIKQLEPTQLAIWISAAPDPQRTALALFYLDELPNYLEILDIAELRSWAPCPSRCLKGRATACSVAGCQTLRSTQGMRTLRLLRRRRALNCAPIPPPTPFA